MPCESPPELNDRRLMAFLDGEADPQVRVHLESCSFCREKVRRLANLQGRLAETLYRVACPPSERLGEYHLGMLDAGRAASIAQHLQECPLCRRELAQLRGFLEELAPQVQLGTRERLQIWIAQLGRKVDEAFPSRPSPAPAYASVRGGEEAPAVYLAGDAQVTLEVQEDASAPGRRVLLGLLTGIETGGWNAHLWQAEARLATSPVDELGNFVLPGLLPGEYELIVGGVGAEIHIQDLALA
jgi:anti-sigma factor RsiW